MSARIAIVLVNWHGWADTIECLASLSALDHEAFCIIVVDNASADDSVAKIENWLHSKVCAGLKLQGVIGASHDMAPHDLLHRAVLIVRAESNGGFASGVNIGLRLALAKGCSACWILNNDTIVERDALAAMERCQTADPKRGVVGSLLCYYDDPERVQVVGGVQFDFLRVRGMPLGEGLRVDDPRVAQLARINPTYIAGASMLVSRAYLEAVGLMDERYFLYFEELDWSTRSGDDWQFVTAQGSIVYHKEGGSIGTSSRALRSLLSQFYMTRGLVNFYRLHRPLLLPLAMMRVASDALRLWRLGEPRHARATWNAVWAAIAGEVGRRETSFD